MSEAKSVQCPWCSKSFATLSGRMYHSRASHTNVDLDLVAYDIVDGEQVPRTSGLQPISNAVARILERVKANQ